MFEFLAYIWLSFSGFSFMVVCYQSFEEVSDKDNIRNWLLFSVASGVLSIANFMAVIVKGLEG